MSEKNVDTTESDSYCSIHQIERGLITGGVLDENGDEFTISYYDECYYCKIEKEESKFYSYDPYEAVEKLEEGIEKRKEKSHNSTIIGIHKTSMIEKYPPEIMKMINVNPEIAILSIEFLISMALSHAIYSNTKGRIQGNIGVLWLGPSGANKTPVKQIIKKIAREIFNDYEEVGQATGKGFRTLVSNKKDDSNEKRHSIKKVLMTWDEVTTMAKDSKGDGTSDILEVLSQAFDGDEMDPYVNKMSYTKSGMVKETYPPLYVPLWLSGVVGGFLNYVDSDFWTQGLANRMIFPKYETNEPCSISDRNADMNKIKQFYKDIEDDLNLIKTITMVQTTSEFMEVYNNYQMEIHRKIAEAQLTLEQANSLTNFEVISQVKYPVLVVKLAMIHAASRFNFTEDGTLTMELVDLESAISDLERYHQNMITMFKEWERVNSGSKPSYDNVVKSEETIINCISNLLANKENRYNTFYREKTKAIAYKGETECIAVKSDEGSWIRHSDLSKKTHWKISSFTEIVNTMMENGTLDMREAIVEMKAKNGGIIPYAGKFYRLRNNKTVE